MQLARRIAVKRQNFISKCQLSPKTTIILQVLSILTAFIFPIILLYFFVEDTHVEVFNFTWIALYSCIFVCLVHKSTILKILVSFMNFFSVSFLTLLFLMSDANLIWKVIIKTVLPFIQIVGLH